LVDLKKCQFKNNIIHKLLISSPKPLVLCTDKCHVKKEKKPLVVVFYSIKKVHESEEDSHVKYNFTFNARNKFLEYKNEFNELMSKTLYSNNFIRYFFHFFGFLIIKL